MQELGAARRAFSRACVLDPNHVQARIALAGVCVELGDPAEAVVVCRQAVAIDPSDKQSLFSLAVALEANGASEEALDNYDAALRIAPDFHDARKNRGALLVVLGRAAEAVENNLALAKSLPFSHDAQFNLGESLLAAKRFPEAVKVLGRAISLSPINAKFLLHTGFALAQCERFSEAQQMLDRAAELDPALQRTYRLSIFGEEKGDAQCGDARLDARTLFLLRHYDAIERCNWRERDHFISKFSELIREAGAAPMTERALGFRAMAMGLDGGLQLSLARQIAAGVQSLLGEQSAPCADRQHPRGAERRVRIGYLSPYFRSHPTGLLAQSLFAWHDREQFEIVAYALGGDDGSEVRKKIADDCDRFVDLDFLDDDAAARKITEDGIDILVDLMGYADKSRPGILARRPAQIQISWLEYIATTGAPWIDYLIIDSVSLPVEEFPNFSEAVIHVPDGRCLCSYAADTPREAPHTRLAAGLPASGMVLGAMHNAYKIEPQVFSVWMRFLKIRPDAVLYLLDTFPEAKSNLTSEAIARDIDPGRIFFAPRVSHEEHLARLQLVDLMLDTPQCNGGTTTADALVAGVPVLTCMGKAIAQRMAASMLSSAGMNNLITESLEAYESLGASLLTEAGRLDEVKQQLRAARSTAPFFFPRKWVQHYEKALILAWQRHCAGALPVSFEVKA